MNDDTAAGPSHALIESIVQGLVQARRYRQPWAPPVFDAALSLEDGYAVQAGVAAAMGWFPSGRATAWKAGGKAQMTAAPLPLVLPSGAHWSPDGGGDLVMEAEVAFRLGQTPTSAGGVAGCIASMCVTIEMVSTRLAGGLQAPPAWKLADQQLHGVLVTGDDVPFAPRDWAAQRCSIVVDGERLADATGSHPNGDALAPLPWLYDFAQRNGVPLRAGDLVTTGAWLVRPVHPGVQVEAHFPGIGTATLSIGR